MMVPKPFATSLSKAGLEEKELLKAVRRAICDGDAPEIVGRWVRHMLNDYERTSTISADASTLTANGGLFKHGEVVSLQKKRSVTDLTS
jgi:flagellar motor component MotA